MEGECTKGEMETTASCPVFSELRTRSCNNQCAWGAYGDCVAQKGWIPIAATTAMDGRTEHAGVWTGTEMIIWGGYGTTMQALKVGEVRKDGAAYNLRSNTWRPISLTAELGNGRHSHSAVWTGSRMIVWGGFGTTFSASGAVYNPSDDSWEKLPASPISGRQHHGAIWSPATSEMVVWGGQGCAGVYCGDGAAYNTVTKIWSMLTASPLTPRQRPTMVYTGTEILIWGGQGISGFVRDGAAFDLKARVWRLLPNPPAGLDGCTDHVSVFDGKELLVWGGFNSTMFPYLRNNGARYLPGGAWAMFSTPGEDVFGAGTQSRRMSAQA